MTRSPRARRLVTTAASTALICGGVLLPASTAAAAPAPQFLAGSKILQDDKKDDEKKDAKKDEKKPAPIPVEVIEKEKTKEEVKKEQYLEGYKSGIGNGYKDGWKDGYNDGCLPGAVDDENFKPFKYKCGWKWDAINKWHRDGDHKGGYGDHDDKDEYYRDKYEWTDDAWKEHFSYKAGFEDAYVKYYFKGRWDGCHDRKKHSYKDGHGSRYDDHDHGHGDKKDNGHKNGHKGKH